jgi:hypothetical protein
MGNNLCFGFSFDIIGSIPLHLDLILSASDDLLFGYNAVQTTMICTNVLNRGGKVVRRPVDNFSGKLDASIRKPHKNADFAKNSLISLAILVFPGT